MIGTQDQNPFRRRGGKGGLRFLLLLAVLLAAGAALPHVLAGRLPAPGIPPADAILVLTGDESRIPEGYRAWKEGRARELYILGAGEGARLERVLPGRPALSPRDARKLHLEGWSENTLENAYSAKSVVQEQGFRKVILVTSDYHMPRAYLSFRTILPKGVAIEVIPVRSEWREQGAFYRTLRRFFVEGWKYWGYRLFLYWE